MRFGEAIKLINAKRNQLLRENQTLMNVGNKNQYQANCNMLKGISFALEKLKKVND